KYACLGIQRQQSNHVQSDRVGPGRGTKRECAAWRGRMARLLDDEIARRLVEPGEDCDVARLLKAMEARAERLVQLDPRGNGAHTGGSHVLRAVFPFAPGG